MAHAQDDYDHLRASADAAAGERPRLRLPPGVALRAARDGVGHALPRGSTRYLCNAMAIGERFAWPVRTTCPSCIARLAALEEVPIAG